MVSLVFLKAQNLEVICLLDFITSGFLFYITKVLSKKKNIVQRVN